MAVALLWRAGARVVYSVNIRPLAYLFQGFQVSPLLVVWAFAPMVFGNLFVCVEHRAIFPALAGNAKQAKARTNSGLVTPLSRGIRLRIFDLGNDHRFTQVIVHTQILSLCA